MVKYTGRGEKNMEPMITKPIYKVRKINDLKELLDQCTALFSDEIAFMSKVDDKYVGTTYKKYKEDVYALGTMFTELGIKNEHIAVIGENRYEWCVTYMATACGGGVIVPLDKELPKSEIENLLKRSKAKAIVFSKKYREYVKEFLKNNENLMFAIDMDSKVKEEGIYSFTELIDDGIKLMSSGNNEFGKTKIDSTQLAGICFTSGTTELAKGVMLSHKNITSNVMAGMALFKAGPGDRLLSILPIHHTYECTCEFLLMTFQGATIYFCEGLKHIQKNLQEAKPTILLVVPLILENMYNKIWKQIDKKGIAKKVKTALSISNFLLKLNIDVRKKLFKDILAVFGGELKVAIAGAAAVNPEVLKGLRGFGITTIQGYGLTESSPLAALNPVTKAKDAAIGIPMPDSLMVIDNPDKDGIGEILIKSDSIMMGYYENQEATDAVLINGWLHSGDIGYRDKEGYFYITGRKKNVIVTKNGKNIFPEEVESYMLKSSYISEIVVYGKDVPDDLETKVCAIIVPNYEEIKKNLQKEEISSEEVEKLIDEEVKKGNKQMPLYKMVREFEIRETEFEKTTTKKIKRNLALKK